MAAYRRVYDSRHLQADCQAPGSAPDVCSVIEYELPLLLLFSSLIVDSSTVAVGSIPTRTFSQ